MNIINKIKAFLVDENGAESVEWVVVAAGITAVAVTLFASGGNLSNALTGVVGKISNKLNALLP